MALAVAVVLAEAGRGLQAGQARGLLGGSRNLRELQRSWSLETTWPGLGEGAGSLYPGEVCEPGLALGRGTGRRGCLPSGPSEEVHDLLPLRSLGSSKGMLLIEVQTGKDGSSRVWGALLEKGKGVSAPGPGVTEANVRSPTGQVGGQGKELRTRGGPATFFSCRRKRGKGRLSICLSVWAQRNGTTNSQRARRTGAGSLHHHCSSNPIYLLAPDSRSHSWG
jgi:hypothetical protein